MRGSGERGGDGGEGSKVKGRKGEGSRGVGEWKERGVERGRDRECAHITGQLLVVLHQLLILLVHRQHLADPVSCCFCLVGEEAALA